MSNDPEKDEGWGELALWVATIGILIVVIMESS